MNERGPVSAIRGPYRAMDALSWVDSLTERLEDRGLESVFMRFMHIEPGSRVDGIMTRAMQAAERGTSVTIRVDGYTSGVVDGDPDVPASADDVRLAQAELFERLRTSPVNFAVDRPVRADVLRWLGRNHTKGVVTERRNGCGSTTQEVDWGGVNLCPGTLGGYDLMCQTGDPAFVAAFSNLLEKDQMLDRFGNRETALGDGNTLVRTGGVGIDRIFHRLIKDEGGADAVEIWSQYPPIHPAQSLSLSLLARRGVPISFYTNGTGTDCRGAKSAIHRGLKAFSGLAPDIQVSSPQDARLHTKAAVLRMRTGLVVWSGSHNFTVGDVPGMTEVAVRSENNALGDAIIEVLEKHKQYISR